MTGMLLSIVHDQVEKRLQKHETKNSDRLHDHCTILTIILKLPIGNFRVSLGLCIKTRLSAQPLIWIGFFTRKVLHVASF